MADDQTNKTQDQDIQPGTIAVWGTGERQQWDGQKWVDLPNIPQQNFRDFQQQFLQQKSNAPINPDLRKTATTTAPSLPGFWPSVGMGAGVGPHPWQSITSTYQGLRDQPGATLRQLGSGVLSRAEGMGNALLDVLNPLRPVVRQLQGKEPTALDNPLAQDIRYGNWPGAAGYALGLGTQVATAKYAPRALELLPEISESGLSSTKVGDTILSVGESAGKELGSVISDDTRASLQDKLAAAKGRPGTLSLSTQERAALDLSNDHVYQRVTKATSGTSAVEALSEDPAATRSMFQKIKAVDPNFETGNLDSLMKIATRIKETGGLKSGLAPTRNIPAYFLGRAAGGLTGAELARAFHLPFGYLVGAAVGGALGGYGLNYVRRLSAIADLMAHPYLTGEAAGGALLSEAPEWNSLRDPNLPNPPHEGGGRDPIWGDILKPPESGGGPKPETPTPQTPVPPNTLPPTTKPTAPLALQDYTNVINAVRQTGSVSPPMIQSLLHQRGIELGYDEVKSALDQMRKEGRLSASGEPQFTPEEVDKLEKALTKKYGNIGAAKAAMAPARTNPKRMAQLMKDNGLGQL